MIFEQFFYWYGVLMTILTFPIVVWICTVVPIIGFAVMERGLTELFQWWEDYWWDSVQEYEEDHDNGTWYVSVYLILLQTYYTVRGARTSYDSTMNNVWNSVWNYIPVVGR